MKRVWEHKNNLVEGFTKRYSVHALVWYEVHDTMESAIQREKALKEWKRAWKLELIEKENPQWQDLYSNLL
jgi:putative endonuclease